MKKPSRTKNDELRPEYDESLIRAGVRGKYAKRYAEGTNLVRIAPDLARVFPDSESVNRALRELVNLARRSAKKAV